MRERVQLALAEPCSGFGCGGTEAQFTRRMIASSVTVHLQCLRCGRSVAGALKRSEFYTFQDFPPWDESLRTAWDDAQQAENLAHIQDFQAARDAKAAEASERRADYRRWLMTSPEWGALRGRVMCRALNICEACLSRPAGDVHHITYALGRLPPAWELRAVCRACHDRLHDWTGGEE